MHIQARQISKDFGKQTALHKFSLELSEGKIHGLLGPNGAGKTTFIRILTRIYQQDAGTLEWDKENIDQRFQSRIGYLPEERGLYKKMKVLEQLVYLAQLKGLKASEAKKECTHWLEKLELIQAKNKRVEQLSKGMAQKVQFISTLVHHPDLLILDEPFSGFDPVNAELIKNEIRAQKKQGKIIILSTHNMNSVEELCDEVTLLNEGQTVLQNSIEKIYAAYPSDTYTVRFEGNIIGFTNALWAGYELMNKRKIDDKRMEVDIRAINGQSINNLLNTVLPEVKIERVFKHQKSMNDIFIDAIKPEVNA